MEKDVDEFIKDDCLFALNQKEANNKILLLRGLCWLRRYLSYKPVGGPQIEGPQEEDRIATFSPHIYLDSAIKDFDAAIEADSKDSASWLGRGVANYHLGFRQQASDDLAECIRLEPNQKYAYLCLAKIHNRADGIWDYESKKLTKIGEELTIKSLDALTKAHAIDPKDPDILFDRSIWYWRKSDKQSQLADLLRVAELAPDSPIGFYWLGLSYGSLGDQTKSKQYYDQSKKLEKLQGRDVK